MPEQGRRLGFTSFVFLVYVAAAASLYALSPRRFRPGVLLVFSYLFYFTWSPDGALLLAALTLVSFAAARGGPSRRRLIPAVAILLAGCLVAFKIALLTPSHGIAGLAMPLGISYYTFKLLGYLLDVHWGKIAPEKSLVAFASYAAFFPQIVAGPIQRPEDFLSQLRKGRTSVSAAIPRLAWGFTKKLVIADNLGPTVAYIYSHVHNLQGAPLWAAFYLFPLQLYADFSGLTDIAIGTGRLFGIEGPENFNRPFAASSIAEFWRRWHMSLTYWLADYVFLPLRMATRRFGAFGLSLSITVNMTAIGLWHGLTSSYLVFGLLNSAYLICDSLSSRLRTRFFKLHPQWNRAGALIGWALTFHLVLVAEVFFRAPHVRDAAWLLGHLLSGFAASFASLRTVLAQVSARDLAVGLIGYFIVELGERCRPDLRVKRLAPAAPRWLRWSFYSAAFLVLAAGVCLLMHASDLHSPFIYEVF